MPALDIQPENVTPLVEVSFEDIGPDSCWDTDNWAESEYIFLIEQFIEELESVVSSETGVVTDLQDLLEQVETPTAFFDAAAARMVGLGFYVYNSDNFFEVYKSDDIEAAYTQEDLSDMLEDCAIISSPSL